MNEDDARRTAAALKDKGFDVVAVQRYVGAESGKWEVRGRISVSGWTEVGRMPLNWRRALGFAVPVEQIEFDGPKSQDDGMDHQTAIDHCEAIRARIGAGASEHVRVVADISTGNEGRYGLESVDDDKRYWRHSDFPEIWKTMIFNHRRPPEAAADPDVPVDTTLTVDLRVPQGALAKIVGQLQIESARLYRGGHETSAVELQDLADGLAHGWWVAGQ